MIFQISSTQIDRKCAPDPMGWIPGPEICKECLFLEEILEKVSLGTVFDVFELIFDRFEHFLREIRQNRVSDPMEWVSGEWVSGVKA